VSHVAKAVIVITSEPPRGESAWMFFFGSHICSSQLLIIRGNLRRLISSRYAAADREADNSSRHRKSGLFVQLQACLQMEQDQWPLLFFDMR
jgi:hypothetical protein